MAFLLHRRLQRRANNQQIPREYLPRVNPITLYSDIQFKKRYRLPKNKIIYLGQQLIAHGFKGPLHGQAEDRNISAVLTVCLGVRFFATGSMYRDIGDAHHVGQSTVCRSVRKTIDLLLAIMEDHMYFPTTRRELEENAQDFFEIKEFPGVVAAVDGTHIGLKPPLAEERSFRNRKGNYSLNAQVMCNANLIFLDVDAKWPGSCHDSFIWRNSEMGKALSMLNFIHPFYILGDSGYPLRAWLMTPYLGPNNQSERDYNYAHASTRNTVERAIGLLKIRFRCLDKTGGVLQSPPGTASQIVACCMVLHNMAIRAGMNLEIDAEDDEDGRGNAQLRHIVGGGEVPHVDPQQQNDEEMDVDDMDFLDDGAEGDIHDRQMNREGQRRRNQVARNW